MALVRETQRPADADHHVLHTGPTAPRLHLSGGQQEPSQTGFHPEQVPLAHCSMNRGTHQLHPLRKISPARARNASIGAKSSPPTIELGDLQQNILLGANRNTTRPSGRQTESTAPTMVLYASYMSHSGFGFGFGIQIARSSANDILSRLLNAENGSYMARKSGQHRQRTKPRTMHTEWTGWRRDPTLP